MAHSGAIPRIDDAIGSLAGATVFSVLDQTSGYSNLNLIERPKK
jgi:hypothetical protein